MRSSRACTSAMSTLTSADNSQLAVGSHLHHSLIARSVGHSTLVCLRANQLKSSQSGTIDTRHAVRIDLQERRCLGIAGDDEFVVKRMVGQTGAITIP